MITIIEDTRQKADKHNTKHNAFDASGIRITRCKLPYGDYALPPKIAVDTKENMSEIASNIANEHARFRKECINALDAGCQLYVLVENMDGIRTVDQVHAWINPELKYRPTAISGERLEKSMKTMTTRYGVRFVFCSPEESAAMIVKILCGGAEDERQT